MSALIFDFKDINWRMNRKPEPVKVSPSDFNDLARESMQLKPAFFTEEEGGIWRPWLECQIGDHVHSIRYETGEEWDEINGMRRK